MKQKNILITGCSSGIGKCLAHGLRNRGYRIFATTRQQVNVDRLSADGFESFRLDLDFSESIRNTVNEVLLQTDSKLYALINNGAYGQPGAVEDLTRDTLKKQFETNVFGTMELTNRIIPVMRAQGHGRIIHISSLLGIVCFAYRGAYNASKFALEALADTMRLELRGTNIHVSLIEPGPIESRFRKNAYAAFRQNINCEQSAHRNYYTHVEQRLNAISALPFTLPPDAVLNSVIAALEARRPRARYAVTFPTRLFALLRRILPVRALDTVLHLVSNKGMR